ncbi:MAG: PKD domain-containing protein [Thermoplasmata archaeon]|nr:PKD domain-containing protein [Thermoplasmata archaeon]
MAESVVPLTVIYNSAELNMTGAEIILTPSMPTAGQTVTLQVTFGNGGSVTAENVLVVVLSDDGELARTFVDDIPPGGIGVATLQWKAAAGTQLLRVVVDPENDLAEPNESNNEATWTMRVSSPDLSVTTTGITISPDYPTEGTDAIISVVVRNLAEQIAPPFDVTLSLEGTTVRTFTVDTGLAGGANVTLETNWTALLGRHEFTVTADPLGHVAEEDRTNNVASRSFSVNTRPIAQLVILMTEVNEGETVSMDASDSEDPDGRVRQYFFDYGDGTDSGWVFSSTINHTYGQTGTFEVRAYVRDEGGAQSAEPALVEVTVNELDKEEGEDTPTLTAPAVLAAIATVAVLAALRGRTRRGEGPGR